MGESTTRLDAFTDAAFAFAVTLLVIGGSEAPTTYAMLSAAVAEVPAFAIGFAIIVMFWLGHVRWRGYRGQGSSLSFFLSVLLVFLVLIYVQPLRAMARSFATFMGGSGTAFEGGLGDLFFLYGAGFAAMAATLTALFAEAWAHVARGVVERAALRGEIVIWSILTLTGLVSVLFAAFDTTAALAPLAYATLPITIGLFAWFYDWQGGAHGE